MVIRGYLEQEYAIVYGRVDFLLHVVVFHNTDGR